MKAGTIEIDMLANLARLSSDMAKTKTMVGGAMSSVERSVNMAKRALGALGIGISAVVFTRMIKGSIDAQAHLRDLSDQTTLSIRTLSGLDLAAKQSGGSLDSAADAISRLSRRMGADAEKFRRLGITAKDPLEAFKQLSDLFLQLDDPMQRSAVMAQALGKSWQGAAPLLAKGSAEIGRMVEKGRELSGITDEGTREASLFNDQMAELGVSFGATRDSLVGKLLPGMNDIVLAMKEAAKEGGILLTVWVGLGGAMAQLIGATERHRTAQRLEEINDQLAVARKQLASGSLRPEGVGSHFFSFLVPDVKLGEQQLARIRQTVTALEQERARLQTSAAAGAPAGATAGATGGDAAAARAAAFLKGSDEAAKKARQKDMEWLGSVLQDGMDEEARVMAEAAQLSDDFRAAERARLREHYDLRNKILIDAHDRDQAEAIARGQTEIAIAKAVAEAKKTEQEKTLAQTHTFLGSLSGLMNTESKKQFKIGKMAAAAETAINTYAAAMGAYKALASIPFVGPALGAAAAAAVALTGAAQIQKINSMEIGGASGASGSFPANPTTGQPIGTPGGDVGRQGARQGGTTTIVNLHGTTYSRAQVRELLEMQNENSVDGSRTVVVER
jgi:hypothetical protein